MNRTTPSKSGQLKEMLLDKIRSGEYPVGGKLPSVRELVKEYNMCKFTVSQVLGSLHEKGYIHLEHRRAAKVLRCPAKYRVGLFYMSSGIRYSFFWGEFLRGIHDEMKEHPEFELVELFNPGTGRSFDPSGVDGTLIMGSNDAKAAAANGKEITDHPMIYIYNCPQEGSFSGVTSDFSGVMQEYIRTMHSQNCRRVLFIDRIQNNSAAEDKLRCLRSAAEKYGVELRVLTFERSGDVKDTVFRRICELFNESGHPDGIILTSDQLAAPVFRAAHECGKKIPQEIKVAGIDNLSDGKFMSPSLTSVDLDRYDQGREAVRMLIDRIRDPKKPFEHKMFPAKIVYRESLAGIFAEKTHL